MLVSLSRCLPRFMILLACALNPLAPATVGFAQSFWQQSALTGDWGGLRRQLEDKGIKLDAVYTGDVFANVSGGIRRRSEYLGSGDVILTLNAEKLVGWRGATFYFYGLGNHGGNPSDNTGDAQGVSNIAAFNTWKLYEAWLQQNLFANRLSLLFGLYDLNSEFAVINSEQVFINSSHGIDPAFAMSGRNGPSIFPTTSAALRVKFKPVPWFYLQTGVFDGVPGNPNNPRGTQIILAKDDGALIATEAAYLIQSPAQNLAESERKRRRRVGRLAAPEYDGKIALGGWYYTAKFDDLVKVDAGGNLIKRTGSYGIYALFEKTVYREKQDSAQGLTLFARVGTANAQVNRFGLYTGSGFNYTGLIPGRSGDELGFAVAAARNGREFRNAAANAGAPVDRWEVNFELTYRAQITPWLALQPDLQYIINPGTNPALKNAFVIGTRFEVSF
jgi:porin